MGPTRSVLVVDAIPETEAVLRAALAGRGVRVLAADRAERGLALAREHRPDLIVLDLEVADRSCQAGPCNDVGAAYTAESRRQNAPLVVIGSARRGPAGLPPDRFVSKPYHYAPLIRRIETLLEERPPRRAAA